MSSECGRATAVSERCRAVRKGRRSSSKQGADFGTTATFVVAKLQDANAFEPAWQSDSCAIALQIALLHGDFVVASSCQPHRQRIDAAEQDDCGDAE